MIPRTVVSDYGARPSISPMIDSDIPRDYIEPMAENINTTFELRGQHLEISCTDCHDPSTRDEFQTFQIDFTGNNNVHKPTDGKAIAENLSAAFAFDHLHQ